LHPDLDGFEGTEENVCDELCTGAGGQVDKGAVHRWREVVAIFVLENFVEAIFAQTLERVSHKRWAPAKKHSPQALLGKDRPPGREVTGVELRVDLPPGLYKIQWHDGGVGWTASYDTAQHARQEVL
jgi:hypothetical protein